ncbi:MAG: deoxyribonuclease IV [Calditrichaeota bacterium]|nr:deoxyribonuclease IV [Calditrichota bacterium]
MNKDENILLGAHVSVAAGVHLAPQRGQEIGCTAIQIFTRNQRQWTSPPLSDDEVGQYFESLKNTDIRSVVAHSSYLINLASPDKNQLQKSRESFILELDRAERLKLDGYIFHPGAHKGAGEKSGMKRVTEQLNLILAERPDHKTKILLETTAGQGTSLGHSFEQLAEMISGTTQPERLGVCLDTCHIFAAGYDFRRREQYEKMMADFDRIIGLNKLAAIHVNDSKTGFGSHVDRHELIGKGEIGLQAFAFIMNDQRLGQVPKIIELPGGPNSDRENLRILKGLRK